MGQLGRQLVSLRQELADAAQAVVDDWDPNEDDEDEVYGRGGVCDAVSSAMADVIFERLDDVEVEDGGWEGDDHAWLLVRRGDELYAVDIPPDVYEAGGGYRWRKKRDAIIDMTDVVIEPI